MRTPAERLRAHHLIQDRKTELIFAFLLFAVGSLLLYDAFDARGKKPPWPVSILTPW